jgi:hypothetical protein
MRNVRARVFKSVFKLNRLVNAVFKPYCIHAGLLREFHSRRGERILVTKIFEEIRVSFHSVVTGRSDRNDMIASAMAGYN